MSGKVPGTLSSIIFADCFLSCRPRLSNELTMGTFLRSLDICRLLLLTRNTCARILCK
jgi:hypothetical protein